GVEGQGRAESPGEVQVEIERPGQRRQGERQVPERKIPQRARRRVRDQGGRRKVRYRGEAPAVAGNPRVGVTPLWASGFRLRYSISPVARKCSAEATNELSIAVLIRLKPRFR